MQRIVLVGLEEEYTAAAAFMLAIRVLSQKLYYPASRCNHRGPPRSPSGGIICELNGTATIY
jgi:hypothetical protein